MKKISNSLISWYRSNKRDLPWRTDATPYHVWLSEIILQQTRVNQGLDYYLRICETFPTIQDLAAAKPDDVLKLWQGLGYYSRARNLHACAQQIVADYNGVFPKTKAELLKLKGVGDYTASAIASIAFGESVVTIDGNVFRVLSRLFDIEDPIDVNASRNIFRTLGEELLDGTNPGEMNQALMEFGALQCTPISPDCGACVIRQNCQALASDNITSRPVKRGKTKIKEVWHRYFIIHNDDQVLVRQRPANGIWGGLFEFPVEETDRLPSWAQYPEADLSDWAQGASRIQPLYSTRHILSHRKINAAFIEIRLNELTPFTSDQQLISWDEFEKLAVSRLVDKFYRSPEFKKLES